MSLTGKLIWWAVGQVSSVTLSVFCLTLLLVSLARYVGYQKRLPPGPWGYPLLGILPLIKKDFHLLLFDYSQKFGNLFSVKMGNQLIVVLSDHKLIRKAFAKSEFAARPKTELGSMLGGYGKFLPRISSGFIKESKNSRQFICAVMSHVAI